MIPRRPRRSDPCFLFGSALALVLQLGEGPPALAQTPSVQTPAVSPPAAFTEAPSPPASLAAPAPPNSDTDALRQHNQDLEAARAAQQEALKSEATLKREIEALRDDRRALNQQLVDTAARVRDLEASIEAIEARLAPLNEQERVLRKSLDERRAVIVEILAALQRIGRRPPPALVVSPQDALGAVRTAITLGAVVPNMRAQADALAGDLTDLTRAREDIVSEHTRLTRELGMLAREQLRMSMLVDERQKKQAAAEQALDVQRQRAADLVRQVDNLKDLIAKLEANRESTNHGAHAALRSSEEGRLNLAALNDPGRLAPAVAFAAMRGHLRLPVNGVRIREFGVTDSFGGIQKGLSIVARPGAQITSPCDGWVVYAGTFRSYGQLLILNAGGGYHVLLAGMQRISVDLGQFVLTGEPVALMGGGRQVPASEATRSKQPVLYVEFRKDGTPIDPSPWWAITEGEKVRG